MENKIYTNEEIKNMSYTDFISLIQEENRPSGGKKTIREIAINSFVNRDSHVLEIGCTNGFSSIEINKLINCNVIGIDINNNSIKNALDKIEKNGLDKEKINFEYGNAECLNFPDDYFDLIICGNALSFVQNKSKAINEIKRVLKPNGFISIVPIWYKTEPNKNIVSEVNKILGFDILCTYEKDWMNFSKYELELYYKKNYHFINCNEKEINNYVNTMIDSKKHLNKYSSSAIDLIKDRWKNTITVFGNNLSQTNYSIILLRKNIVEEEAEIFMTEEDIIDR